MINSSSNSLIISAISPLSLTGASMPIQCHVYLKHGGKREKPYKCWTGKMNTVIEIEINKEGGREVGKEKTLT